MNLEKILSFFKTENVTKAINISLIILVIIGGYFLYQNFKRTPTKVTNTIPNNTESNSKKLLTVDVSGAVIKPGVYELPNGSRVVDAVKVAGGFTDKADQKFIDKNINKAQLLTDGLKIYFPNIDDQALVPQVQSTNSSSGLISINNSSKQDLIDLPEIGEVTADKIIAARPFSFIEDLVAKKCITQNQLEKIKDRISL